MAHPYLALRPNRNVLVSYYVVAGSKNPLPLGMGECQEELLEEFRKRQESASDRKKLTLETADRGNLAVLSEHVPEGKNEQYLRDCQKLDDSELCWKLFNTLHEHCSERGMTEDEQVLDATRLKGYRLKHAMGHLHAFRCVGKEEFPEWFFLHEKLKRNINRPFTVKAPDCFRKIL